MKFKEFLAVASIVGFTAACSSPYRATDTNMNGTQTTAVVVAPAGVHSAFTTQYPTASNLVWSSYDATVVPIEWDMTGWNAMSEGDYLARFDMDGDNYYAWYDANGNWVGSAYAVRDLNTVPSVVSKAVMDKYPGYTIQSVQRELHKDGTRYEVVATNADTKAKLLVDPNGTIVKEKTKPLDK